MFSSKLGTSSSRLGTAQVLGYVPPTLPTYPLGLTAKIGISNSRLGFSQILGVAPTLVPNPEGCPTITASSIVPDEGTTLGGTVITITGENLADLSYNDAFTQGFLDFSKWVPLGTPPPVVGPLGPLGSCQCVTGTPSGSYSGLRNIVLTPLADYYVEISFQTLNMYIANQPSSEVTLAAIDAAIDSNNYQRLSLVVIGPNATTGILRAEVWSAGVQIYKQETPFSSNQATLGLMRYQDPVEGTNKAVFFLNGMKIIEFFDAPAGTAAIRFFSWNESANYNVTTNFANFVSHSIIIFESPGGCDVALNMEEITENVIRGTTPPTVGNWAGLDTIIIVNGGGLDCRATGVGYWTYQYAPSFIVGQSSPGITARRQVSFTNDPILRNPTPNNVGVGVGRQF